MKIKFANAAFSENAYNVLITLVVQDVVMALM
jgi:hypothetical protein